MSDNRYLKEYYENYDEDGISNPWDIFELLGRKI